VFWIRCAARERITGPRRYNKTLEAWDEHRNKWDYCQKLGSLFVQQFDTLNRYTTHVPLSLSSLSSLCRDEFVCCVICSVDVSDTYPATLTIRNSEWLVGAGTGVVHSICILIAITVTFFFHFPIIYTFPLVPWTKKGGSRSNSYLVMAWEIRHLIPLQWVQEETSKFI